MFENVLVGLSFDATLDTLFRAVFEPLLCISNIIVEWEGGR